MAVRNGGGENLERNKIFVGGLSWETDKDKMKAHFAQFGEVTDSVVMIDPATKNPRGFGFVTFADQNAVSVALKQPGMIHTIDGKRVDPKPAQEKNSDTPGNDRANKIFVGGVEAHTSEEDLAKFFSQFGTVTDVELKTDKNTSRIRGFGFVAFEDQDVVDKVLKIHYHQINGKTVEVKKAQPRNATQQGGGGGSFGRGGGSYGQAAFQQASAGGGGGYGRGGGGGYMQYPTQAAYGGYTATAYGQGQQQQQQQQQQQAVQAQHQQQQQGYYGAYYPPNPATAQYGGPAQYGSGYAGGAQASQQQVTPAVQSQQMVAASYGQQDASGGYPTSAGYTAEAYAGQAGYSYGGTQLAAHQPAATYQQQQYGGTTQATANTSYGQPIGRGQGQQQQQQQPQQQTFY